MTHLFQIVSFWILSVFGLAVHWSTFELQITQIVAVAWSLAKYSCNKLLAAEKKVMGSDLHMETG